MKENSNFEKEKDNIKSLNYDEKLHILTIGNSEVGKTSLLVRYTQNKFSMQHLATIGIDHFTKNEEINGLKLSITVWDTAGQERYKSLASSFFRNAHGIILVYDVSNRESFTDLQVWLDSIKSNLGNENTVKKIIIGNKIDLEREVSKEEAIEFCKKLNIDYFESSAKENINVKEAFQKLILLIMGNKIEIRKSSIIRLSDKPEEKDSNSCKC